MSSINATVAQINAASTTVVLVLGFVNFTLGAIGLIFNLLIFTRSSLRCEPCSLYFSSSTCFSLFVVYVIVPLRILANNFNLDSTNYNLGICRIEFFVNYSTRAISCWLIVLACVDRFAHSSTSVRIRRWSALKTAKWAIGVTTVAIMLSYSHILVYYEITYELDRFGNTVPTCNARKGIYRTFNGFWYMSLYSLCPSLLTLLFGFLTLNNLRQHRRVIPRVPGINRIVRRSDNQILRMLIAQVLVVAIATLPYSINQLYSTFTIGVVKSTLRVAQETFATRTLGAMTTFAHTISFYLYTLTGTIFRKELRKIIHRCCHPTQNALYSGHRERHPMAALPRHRNRATTPLDCAS